MEIILKILENIFGCSHRFLKKEVHDLNSEPKCVKCDKFFTMLTHGKIYRFVIADKDHYKIKRARK